MRKRGLIVALGVATLAVLALAPGTASAHDRNPDGDIMVLTPPATTLAEGVWAPLGGGLGDVTIEPAELKEAAGVTAIAPGGGLGDVTVEHPRLDDVTATPSMPEPVAPTGNTCYQGACADTTLAEALPDDSAIFGGGAHSYGPQQAIRLGVLSAGF